MIVRRTHEEKRLERSFGIHTGHNTVGNVRSFVANRFIEFKILTFKPMEKIVKLKDSQLEIRKVKKKFK
jgi:hypothetical protein